MCEVSQRWSVLFKNVGDKSNSFDKSFSYCNLICYIVAVICLHRLDNQLYDDIDIGIQ